MLTLIFNQWCQPHDACPTEPVEVKRDLDNIVTYSMMRGKLGKVAAFVDDGNGNLTARVDEFDDND